MLGSPGSASCWRLRLSKEVLLCVWPIITFLSSFAVGNSQRLGTLLPALNLSCLNGISVQLSLLFLVDRVFSASEVFPAILFCSAPFLKSRLQAGPRSPWVPSRHHVQQVCLTFFFFFAVYAVISTPQNAVSFGYKYLL